MNKSEINLARKSKATHFHIKKGSYYYRQNSAGYTDDVTQAGVYTKEEAIRHAENCRELWIIPIDRSEYNKLLIDNIKDMLSRII